MAELRYNPMVGDWVMIASHRQNRPQMPKDWCPFCPGSGKVPDEFEVFEYDNDFPSMMQNPPKPDDVATDLFKTRECYGKSEVILYSSNHTITLPELPQSHVEKLVGLWCERFEEIRKDKNIKYIFIFENRGEAVYYRFQRKREKKSCRCNQRGSRNTRLSFRFPLPLYDVYASRRCKR